MSYTKRQFVTAAFEEIGLASYVFDLQPEQLQGALKKLDAMMATWNALGIRLGYPIPTSPENSDLDEETNVPDRANEAVYLNLAVRLAPSHGKTVTMETKKAAKDAYNVILNRAAMPNEMQITGLPAGAGNKKWRDGTGPFLDDPNTDPIQIVEGGYLEFGD